MKKIGLIAIMAIGMFTAAIPQAKAQSTNVPTPFAMLDSTCFAVKPYYNSVNQGYMQLDSFAVKNGYKYTNYPVGKQIDTVRFARQRSLMIQVTASTPVGAFTLIVHKDSTGTINAAKAYLEGSNDGINFYRLNDTMTCTNQSVNSHTWILPIPNHVAGAATSTSSYKDSPTAFLPFLYYHILFVGVATSKADIKAFYVPRHNSTSPN